MELCKVCIEQHTGGCGIATWDNARVRKWFLDKTFLTEEEKTKLDQVTGGILVGLQENAYIAEFGGLRGRFIYQEVCLAAGAGINTTTAGNSAAGTAGSPGVGISPFKAPPAARSQTGSPSQRSKQKVSNEDLTKRNIQLLELPTSNYDISRNAVPYPSGKKDSLSPPVYHWVKLFAHRTPVLPHELAKRLQKLHKNGIHYISPGKANTHHRLHLCPDELQIQWEPEFLLYMEQVYLLSKRLDSLKKRLDLSEGTLEADAYVTLDQPVIIQSMPPLVHAWRAHWADDEWKSQETTAENLLRKKEKSGWLPDGIVGHTATTLKKKYEALPPCATEDVYLPFLIMEHKKDPDDHSDMNKLVYEMYLGVKLQESMGWEVPIVFGIYFAREKFWFIVMTKYEAEYVPRLLATYSIFDDKMAIFRVANIMWRLRLYGINSARRIRKGERVNVYEQNILTKNNESCRDDSTEKRKEDDREGDDGEDRGGGGNGDGSGRPPTVKRRSQRIEAQRHGNSSSSGGRQRASDPYEEKENIDPQCRSLKGQSGRLYCTGTHVFDLNNTIIGDGKVNSCCIMKDLPVVIKWRKHDLSSQEIHDVYLHHNREYEALRRLWIAGEASRIIKVYDRGLDTDWKLPFLVLELVPFAEALAPRILADIPLYLMKILQGVAFCHAHDITHHDLKEDNILWQPETKEMKLIDFDLAKVPNMPHSPCSATKGYLAPEIALCRGKCSPKVDLWSVGVIVFDVLFGVRPSDNDIMYTFALEWLPKLVASHPNTIHLKHFYKTLESWIQAGLLRRIEKESCQALHTAEAFQLLGGLLAFKPEDRLSAEAALCSPFFSHLS